MAEGTVEGGRFSLSPPRLVHYWLFLVCLHAKALLVRPLPGMQDIDMFIAQRRRWRGSTFNRTFLSEYFSGGLFTPQIPRLDSRPSMKTTTRRGPQNVRKGNSLCSKFHDSCTLGTIRIMSAVTWLWNQVQQPLLSQGGGTFAQPLSRSSLSVFEILLRLLWGDAI